MLTQEKPSSQTIDLVALARFICKQRIFMERHNLHISLVERFKYLVTDAFIIVSKETGREHDRIGLEIKVSSMSKSLFYVTIVHRECKVDFTMSLNEDCFVWAEEIVDAYNYLYAQIENIEKAG